MNKAYKMTQSENLKQKLLTRKEKFLAMIVTEDKDVKNFDFFNSVTSARKFPNNIDKTKVPKLSEKNGSKFFQMLNTQL